MGFRHPIRRTMGALLASAQAERCSGSDLCAALHCSACDVTTCRIQVPMGLGKDAGCRTPKCMEATYEEARRCLRVLSEAADLQPANNGQAKREYSPANQQNKNNQQLRRTWAGRVQVPA